MEPLKVLKLDQKQVHLIIILKSKKAHFLKRSKLNTGLIELLKTVKSEK